MSDDVLILLSGGVDSTALIHYYTEKGFKVTALHFQYGQKNNISELESINKVCSFYNIDFSTYDLGFPIHTRNHEYMCRNALFIISAAALIKKHSSRIAIGVHSGVPYYDCSPEFIEQIQSILDGYYSGTVVVDAPFIYFSKSQVYEYCKLSKVPIELTYSCEISNYNPCGTCPSCYDRRLLYDY